MQRTSWGTVVAAVATVLVCVAVQMIRGSSATGVGEAAYGREVEGYMADGRWDDVIRVCQKELQKHPLERRAHFYLGRGLAEAGLPEPALLHLILSAIPPSSDSGPKFLPPPSENEIDEQVSRLAQRFPSVMDSDWARWRKARLAAVRQDWARMMTELAPLSSADDGRDNDVEEGEALALAMGVATATFETLPGAQRLGGVLVRLGMVTRASWQDVTTSSPGSLSALSLIAGGEFAGNCCLLRIRETAYRRDVADGWLFLSVDARTGRVLDERSLTFAPLTRDVESIEAWLNSLPEDALLVACVSGEALNVMSVEARDALSNLLDLRKIPAQESLLAYGFVAFQTGDGVRAVEAVAAAADVPVMMRTERLRE